MLLDYLLPEATAFNLHCESPQEAVTAAVGLLCKSGAVNELYIDDVLEGYQKYGPYFVLTPGFAMPHAQPSGKCNRPAVGFVKLASPLCFGHATNDPVHYLMPLCGTDHDSHRQLLRDLMGFLSSDVILEALPTLGSFDTLKQLIEEVGI